MNTQEINIAVANILGIDYIVDKSINKLLVKNDATGCLQVLDYTSDWNLCGPLTVKLGEAGWDYSMVEDHHCWSKYKFCNASSDDVFVDGTDDEAFLVSTCLAFIEEYKK